jgi:hypothetical protein
VIAYELLMGFVISPMQMHRQVERSPRPKSKHEHMYSSLSSPLPKVSLAEQQHTLLSGELVWARERVARGGVVQQEQGLVGCPYEHVDAVGEHVPRAPHHRCHPRRRVGLEQVETAIQTP